MRDQRDPGSQMLASIQNDCWQSSLVEVLVLGPDDWMRTHGSMPIRYFLLALFKGSMIYVIVADTSFW